MRLNNVLIAVTAAVLVGDRCRADEDTKKPTVAATFADIKDAKQIFAVQRLRPPRGTSVVVVDVQKYGPAEKAGLQRLDVISLVDRKKIGAFSDFADLIANIQVGQTLRIAVQRPQKRRGRQTWKRHYVNVIAVTRRDARLNALSTQTDPSSGLKFYQHRDAPPAVNARSDIYAYFPAKDGMPQGQMGLRIQYVDSKWLYIQKFTLRIDDQLFTIQPTSGQIQRKSNKRNFWEWYDAPVTSKYSGLIEDIVRAKKVTLTHHGREQIKERNLSDPERERLGVVLDAFKMMGGEILDDS